MQTPRMQGTGDVAVLVNLRSRRGSARVARLCRTALPQAQILASRSLEEVETFTRSLPHSTPRLVVAAGGDGTAVALINALRKEGGTLYQPEGVLQPVLGVMPLGTGNGWAHSTGAPRWPKAIARLRHLVESELPIPRSRFNLVEVAGIIAPFAGTGWDAEIIDDFHAQRDGFGILPKHARNGLRGYLHGLVTRSIPRNLFRRRAVEVELINEGDDALTVDEAGRPVPVVGGGHGAVLYRGRVSVCAAGTSPEWGFRFRAFPFANLVPGRFCMRIYSGNVVEAALRMDDLWRGRHPVPKMHTWLVNRCRAIFSEPVPFQVGGDRLGHQTEVVYSLAAQKVDLLNWSKLKAA